MASVAAAAAVAVPGRPCLPAHRDRRRRRLRNRGRCRRHRSNCPRPPVAPLAPRPALAPGDVDDDAVQLSLTTMLMCVPFSRRGRARRRRLATGAASGASGRFGIGDGIPRARAGGAAPRLRGTRVVERRVRWRWLRGSRWNVTFEDGISHGDTSADGRVCYSDARCAAELPRDVFRVVVALPMVKGGNRRMPHAVDPRRRAPARRAGRMSRS